MMEINYESLSEPEENPIWNLLHIAHHVREFRVVDDSRKTDANSRRIWNALIAEELDADEIESIVANTGFSKSDFEPLAEAEFEMIVKGLDNDGIKLPLVLSEVSFDNTFFQEELDLRGYLFVNMTFDSCTFGSGFSLDGCVVLDELSVTNCQHLSKVKVLDTKVFGSANFKGTNFISEAEFSDGYFEAFGVERCVFESEASFRGIEVGADAHFTGAVFNHSTSFKGTRFRHQVPRFFGATIHEDTNFADVQWPKTSHTNSDQAESARDAVRAYECLKRIVGDQRKFRLEHMFLQLEMKSQERTEGFIQSIPSRLFRYLSDYGWSYIRPVVALVVTWISAGVYFALATCDEAKKCDALSSNDWLEALALSFANLFAFLGIGRTLLVDELAELNEITGAETVAGIQMVIGPIFIFFVLLAFRNRFRMK